MSYNIKDIAHTICGQPLCGEPCDDCEHDDGNCTHILTAKCIYTAHFKPMEDALANLQDDFGRYVYHTTNGQLSSPYDVQMLIAMHNDDTTEHVERETEYLKKTLTAAKERERLLVEHIKKHCCESCPIYDTCDGKGDCDTKIFAWFDQASRAALANVKEVQE